MIQSKVNVLLKKVLDIQCPAFQEGSTPLFFHINKAAAQLKVLWELSQEEADEWMVPRMYLPAIPFCC